MKKLLAIIIDAIYLIASVLFVFQLHTVGAPMKYLLIVGVVLLIIYLLGLLIFTKVSNKIIKVIEKIFLLLLSVVLMIGNGYIFNTTSTMDKLSKNDDKIIYSVVVKKESPIKELNALSSKTLGYSKVGNVEYQEETIKKIEDSVTNLTKQEANSYTQLADNLYKDQCDAILINESNRALINEKHPKFDEETRVIKQFKYDAKKVNAKKVDVDSEAFNVFISGIDTYGALSTTSRSDVNIVASINPKTHQVLLIGIPRDFYVAQPCQGGAVDKLTHAGIYGVNGSIETIEDLLDCKINYYARVNFSTVTGIVDALGGIDVDSPNAFVTKKGGYQIKQGINHLNGDQTLGFVRERYSFKDGDRERSRNQMRAIEAMIKKCLSPAIINNYNSVLNSFAQGVDTNMERSEMTSLIRAQLSDGKGWDVKKIQVSGSGSTQYSPANGFNSYVMIPNQATVDNAIKLLKKIDSGKEITDADVKHQDELVGGAGYWQNY